MSKTIKEQVVEYHNLFNANVVNEKGITPHTSGEWVKKALQERDRIAREEERKLITEEIRRDLQAEMKREKSDWEEMANAIKILNQ